MLGALAFAVPSVRHGIFLATSSASKNPPAGIPPLTEGKYLAVLPFGVEGDASALGSIAEGLDQELSTKLLALRNVSVASARAAQDVDLRGNLETIARSLGANLIVRGTVQGNDKAIQIKVNLENVANGTRQLDKTFSGKRRELLTLEDQIYEQILRALDLNPSGEEMNRAATHPTGDPEAYELYTKGRNAYRGHPDINGVKTAIGFYQEALARDGHFALAYAGMADASLLMYRETHDSLWIHKAMNAAEKAQKLDDNLKEAHLSLGRVYRETGKTEEAIKELTRALQISPRSDDCYRQLGRVYVDAGKKDLAIRALQNAVTLNRYYWSNQNELGIAYLQFGEYAKAVAAFRRVIELDPTNATVYQNIGAVYVSQGKYEESIPEFERAIALQSLDAEFYSDFGVALLYLKRYSEALYFLQKSAEMHPNDEAVIGNLADGYRWAGQERKAMKTYDRAISLANQELDVNPRDASALGSLGSYYAKKGDTSLAQHYIHRARSVDDFDPQLVYDEAVIHALANEPASAMESLRSALAKGISAEQAMLDPEFRTLRDNLAFKKLISDSLEKSK
jgi:tetratricopeptide (TPR) repeat protein